MLAGCGSANDTASPPPKGAAASSPVAGASSQQNPLAAAGVTDYAAFKQQFLAFQEAAARGDKESVAAFALYPIRVNVGKVAVNVADQTAFIEQYDRIMTEPVRKALADQDADSLFANDKGVMVGRGEIWFGVAPGAPEKYGIISVNVGDEKK